MVARRPHETFTSFPAVKTLPHVKIGVRTSRLGQSLSRASFRQTPFRQALSDASLGGVDGVEVDLRDELPLTDISGTGIRQIRKWLDDQNLKLAAVRYPTRRSLADPNQLERRIAAIERAMVVAYDLGSRRLVQAGGLPDINTDTIADSTLAESLARLHSSSQRIGCHLIVEPERIDPEAARQLADQLGGGIFQLALHTGHTIAAGESIADLSTSLASYWQHVYLADGYRDIASRRFVATQLGRGAIDIAELAAILDGACYDGWWMVETTEQGDRISECAAAAAYLRNL